MDTTDIINTYLAPLSSSDSEKGIHKIALQARIRESLYRPPNPSTRPSFTLAYAIDRLLHIINPADKVKIIIHRIAWNVQAYFHFLLVANIGLIKTIFLDPYRLLFHPLSAIAALLFFIAIQFVGLGLVIFIFVLRITGLYKELESRRDEYAGGYSIFNMGDPGIFTRYNENVEKAKRVFAQGRDYVPSSDSEEENHESELEDDFSHRVRHFNLDVCKTLLLLCATMYERNEEVVHKAILESHANKPSAGVADLVRAEARLRDLARTWGLQFAGISDLNTYGGAYCGLWWDPRSNWLVLSFKGTTPLSGAEWLKDITLTKANASAYLFGDVNQGFYDKLFPDYATHVKYSPYGNIVQTIKLAASELKKGKIHLYVTGHSLGAAIATAFYARAIKSPSDFGEHIKISNAYLFGTPRIGDVEFSAGFYSIINQPFGNPQTMFRVVNGADIVCRVPIGTGAAPTGHDYNFKGSMYNYSHVGETVFINGGQQPVFLGNSFAPGIEIKMVQDVNQSGYDETNGSSASSDNGAVHVKFTMPDVHSLTLDSAKKLATKQTPFNMLGYCLPRIFGDHLPTRYMANIEKLNPDAHHHHKPGSDRP